MASTYHHTGSESSADGVGGSFDGGESIQRRVTGVLHQFGFLQRQAGGIEGKDGGQQRES